MNKVGGRKASKAPARRGNTVAVNLSMSPGELAELDALAGRLGRFGHTANRSGTVVDLVHTVLNAEADGLLSIEDGRIYLNRRPRDDR